jgi:integrase
VIARKRLHELYGLSDHHARKMVGALYARIGGRSLANGELRFMTRKTRRAQVIPIAPPLLSCLTSLPSSDDPKAPVFPHARALIDASKNEHVGALSNEFHELLVEAGLAVPHVHQRTGEGRSARRKIGALGFHSLRHTFTSWAKSAGIGSAIVQDIVARLRGDLRTLHDDRRCHEAHGARLTSRSYRAREGPENRARKA